MSGEMPSLAETLLARAPRESSGGPSSNRHQFHRTWALCHLLRLHEAGRPYVLILEYHDDVIVLDGETDPQAAEFFQIKTKKAGLWTRAKLLAIEKELRKKSGPRSILGKLTDHLYRFGEHVRSVTVVSNASFDLKTKTAPPAVDRERVLVTELAGPDADAIRAAIKDELQRDDDLPWDRVSFWATGISLTEHESYGLGQLAAFLDRRNPGCRTPVVPLFRTLRDELGRRGDAERKPVHFDQLCSTKGIRRADLDAFLQLADISEAAWSVDQLRSELQNESFAYRERAALIGSFRRYAAERLDRTNAAVQEFSARVAAIVDQLGAAAEWRTLAEFLPLVVSDYAARHGGLQVPFDQDYLRGASLFELKAREAREYSSSNTEPSPEAP